MPQSVEVVLVSMPFAPLLSPSIGLGLLKSSLKQININSTTLYFNLRFAKLIGESSYTKITDTISPTDLVGEWIFSESLFNHQSDDSVAKYVDQILRYSSDDLLTGLQVHTAIEEDLIERILFARASASDFLRECLADVLKYEPEIVGFTSMFEQHLASLSLAKMIKQERPDIFTVFGGSNCESVMGYELVRQFHFVDAVVSGEGEFAFPSLVKRVLAGQSVSDMEGVFYRDRSPLKVLNQPLRNTPRIDDLDRLPIPDYDDYFEQFNNAGLRTQGKPSIMFETSRGCWWGEKHHCTFCGLNGETMTYRSKSSKRALDELMHLVNAYPGHNVNLVDNILDMDYFKEFIPAIAEMNLDAKLFYEVKANLKKDQLRLLLKAGVNSLQPGIESLSDEVLQIMRKGIKALQNIQLLKWCEELGIKLFWNLIMGFPGEPSAAYDRMAGIIPLLTHLQPPVGTGVIRIDRFSPNFERAGELGFKNLNPYPAYGYVYPLPPEAIRNLAYFFTFEYKDPRDVSSYTRSVTDAAGAWRKCNKTSTLFWVEKNDLMMVWDSRPIADKPLTVLKGLEKFVYASCDEIRKPEQILELWKSQFGKSTDVNEIVRILKGFVAKRIMIEQDNRYLSLAIPRSLQPEANTALFAAGGQAEDNRHANLTS